MRLEQIVVDCLDPARLVRFWAGLLGGEPVDREHGWAHVVPPGWPRISFQPVPEAKAVKNRLHLDVDVDDIAEATEQAVRLGATARGGVQTDEQGSFQVLLDPAGNEFCFVKAHALRRDRPPQGLAEADRQHHHEDADGEGHQASQDHAQLGHAHSVPPARPELSP